MEPNFKRFFIGNATSLLGDALVGVALSFAVLDLTKSAADLGYVLSARSVPMVATLLFGGVIADRFPRRLVMITADLARCGSQGITAWLLISGQARIWELVVLQAVHGTATASFNPAVTGLIHSIVARDQLQQANARRGMALSAASIVGPALAGAIVAASSPGWAIAVDAATFGISATQLVRLRLAEGRLQPSQSFLRDLHDGWAELRSRTWLWTSVSFASLSNMLYASFLVLGPLVARRANDGPLVWASLVMSLAAGSLAGAAVSLRIRPRWPLRTAAVAQTCFSLPAIGLAARLPLIALIGSCVLAGAGATLSNILSDTALQNHVGREALSRISSFELFGSFSAQPVGQLGSGPLAGAIGVGPTLLIAGSGQLASALAALAIPAIRRLPARPDRCLPSRHPG